MAEKVQHSAKTGEVKRENSASKTKAMDYSQSMSLPVDQVLYLQRTIGNQAVQRLIKSGTLQAKLKIGQPGDKYEQEADRVADAVMRMPERGVQRQEEPEEEEELVQGKTLETVQQQPEEEEELLQGKALDTIQCQVPEEEKELMTKLGDERSRVGGSTATSDLETSIQQVRGRGQPLSNNTRVPMEQAFGADFSDVRVHADIESDKFNNSLQARAFTTGQDVFFKDGEYNPGSASGRELLAHELTHVVQQRDNTTNIRTALAVSTPYDPGEREAETIANQVMTGPESQASPVIVRQPTMIQRDVNFDLFIRGENYWFTNPGQARIAALTRATQLGPGHTIKHHPLPAVGQPHYHIVNPLGKQVAGHFFYGRKPPIKERNQNRYRQRSREALRRTGIAAAIGSGVGLVLGAIIGGVGGGASGTLVAPGVGTIGGAIGGGTLGAAKGAAIGGLAGGAIGAGLQTLWNWATE